MHLNNITWVDVIFHRTRLFQAIFCLENLKCRVILQLLLGEYWEIDQKSGKPWANLVRKKLFIANLHGAISVFNSILHTCLVAYYTLKYDMVHCNLGRWCCGAVGRASDLRPRGRGFKSRPGTQRKNSGHVSHTYVPLSPSSISWYQPKGGDALQQGCKGRYGSCVGGR